MLIQHDGTAQGPFPTLSGYIRKEFSRPPEEKVSGILIYILEGNEKRLFKRSDFMSLIPKNNIHLIYPVIGDIDQFSLMTAGTKTLPNHNIAYIPYFSIVSN
jgi:hypothetical protein